MGAWAAFNFKADTLSKTDREKLEKEFDKFLMRKVPDATWMLPGASTTLTRNNWSIIEVKPNAYRLFHSRENYKDFVMFLQSLDIPWEEVYVNDEDSGRFFTSNPLTISNQEPSYNELKEVQLQGVRHYLYYMPDDIFQRQNVFQSQLISTGAYKKPLHEADRNDLLYVYTEYEDGYIVQARGFDTYIRDFGYFHFIRINDIDTRIIQELKRTNEYVIEEDGGWYFIFKKKYLEDA